MKKVLLCAATKAEIEPFLGYLEAHFQREQDDCFRDERWQIRILITGVGMMATAYSLAAHLAVHRYDAAIQAGIAGCFDSTVPLGTVLGVGAEQYGDLGAEDREGYIDIFSLGFLAADTPPFVQGKLHNEQPFLAGKDLPFASALSVNTVSGQAATIEKRRNAYGAQLESMEGISFHYACLQQGLPFLQLRAVSNYVTPRNRAEWNIGLAIGNLNQYLQQLFTLP
ncbi:MAG TPA: futalosine hydrolase [Chitinophagaceae bacterium]|nr:futalosine hydrolase [Chitinophagaceae bacterium]